MHSLAANYGSPAKVFFFTCLEQESISFALLWYQSVSSSMEGVAERNLSSSGASSYRKLSSSNRFWSSTALKKTSRERGGCVTSLLGLSNKHKKHSVIMLTDDTSRKSHDFSEKGHSLGKIMMMQLWQDLYQRHVPLSLENLIYRLHL